MSAPGCNTKIDAEEYDFCYRHWIRLPIESMHEVYRSRAANGPETDKHIETLRRVAATLETENIK